MSGRSEIHPHQTRAYMAMKHVRKSVPVQGELSAKRELEVVQKILSGERYTPSKHCPCRACFEHYGLLDHQQNPPRPPRTRGEE